MKKLLFVAVLFLSPYSHISFAQTLAPDGTYVGGEPRLAPDGTYVAGQPRLAPDGTYVGGQSQLAPDGTRVDRMEYLKQAALTLQELDG